ncbi:MAG: carbamoyltransferase HypF [Thermoplasmata archaeon]|nr:MAG: carbamoyltransferase HypF [Thermoplasmata archaeon]
MRLIFYGLVQGVGFRPAVFRAAQALGLKGFIRNNGSNVEVVIDGDHKQLLEQLDRELPPLARITEIEVEEGPTDKQYSEFTIKFSEDGERTSVIPADTAICQHCQDELFSADNRRYHHPFINCTDCGARFSAIKAVPYDRVNTSMKAFVLCEKCKAEYDSPSNRRFFAQTISCRGDGPKFTLYGKDRETIETEDEIHHFASAMDDGAIGVLKSWGGMHLICNLDSRPRFRAWYGRQEKPFAVMARNLEVVKAMADISPFEEALLTSPERPIVIVQKRKEIREEPRLELVSPGLDNIGLYLPYSAIQHLLFFHLRNDAIVMTSANPPGEPIITSNEKVFELGADLYLLHNREIINRKDDSVIVPWVGRRFFIRKSRGFVPLSLNPRHKRFVVGVGAEENVTASLSLRGKMYTTQYIGDVRDYNVYEFERAATLHLMELFGVKTLDGIGADMHPLYTSKRFAYELGERFGADIIEIQHHWAHAVSLMVDNDLSEPIICLTLDGAGFGSDGHIWGGEVLLSSFTDFRRVAHLEYLPLIGGDLAVADPRRLVFAITQMIGKPSSYFDDEKTSVLRIAQKHAPLSCSFGRFLDAISCHLGVCCKKTYDGEPAIKLERYLFRGKRGYEFTTEIEKGDAKVIRTLPLFRQLFEYTEEKTPTEREGYDLAHSMVSSALAAMVEVAADKAEQENIGTIGITGGVSYNLPIVNIVKEEVERRGLSLATHNSVANGDGGISTGQNAIAGSILESS